MDEAAADAAVAVRYGVIGTGMMGCEHIRNLVELPGAEVVAVADPVERSQRWARHAVGNDAPLAVYDDHRRMLDEAGLDAVVVATPNFTHAAVLDDILGRDVHVMVEKPLCTTVEDCQAVIEAARSHSGIVWVGLEYRYMPPVAAFLAQLADGAVGDLKMLAIREHRFPFLAKVGDWNRFNRYTGGTLVEKCCHFFDLMRLAVGAEAVRVYASGGRDVNHLDERYAGEVPDIIDNAFVVVDFANGVRALLDLCMFAEGSTNEQELVATGDTGKLECFIPEATLRVSTRTPMESRTLDVRLDPRVAHDGFHHGSSYLEHLDFLGCIRVGGAPTVTLDDGLASVAIGVAAHRSIDEGRPVTLAEVGYSRTAQTA